MDNLTIFVSSSDDYEDCWPGFFTLLRRHWPDCDLPIVLNTETKSFDLKGLEIVSTCLGRQRSFGEAFLTGLERVRTDHVLLLMIDYFLMGPVRVENLLGAHRSFVEERLDGLYLVEMTTIRETTQLTPMIRLVSGPGQDRFSFQAAIWRKRSLTHYVLPHETPWLAEQFGSRRYGYTGDRLAYVERSAEPFDYLHTGVLHKGGWIEEARPFLEQSGLALDWSARGFYEPKTLSIGERLAKRRKTAALELESRIDLFCRQLKVIKP